MLIWFNSEWWEDWNIIKYVRHNEGLQLLVVKYGKKPLFRHGVRFIMGIMGLCLKGVDSWYRHSTAE